MLLFDTHCLFPVKYFGLEVQLCSQFHSQGDGRVVVCFLERGWQGVRRQQPAPCGAERPPGWWREQPGTPGGQEVRGLFESGYFPSLAASSPIYWQLLALSSHPHDWLWLERVEQEIPVQSPGTIGARRKATRLGV